VRDQRQAGRRYDQDLRERRYMSPTCLNELDDRRGDVTVRTHGIEARWTDHDPELGLERESQLEQIERVGCKVFHERGLESELGLAPAEFLRADNPPTH